MSDDFKVLSDRLHCLLRPGMYIGSATPEVTSGIIDYKYQSKTIVPALIKMIEEIYQNSVDEYIRTNGKFADKISITFTDSLEGTEICVEDNGRGIPQDIISGLPRPVHAWTSLRAGSNFDDSSRVGVGANGVGSSLTNIFSTSFRGETSDGKNKLTVICSNNMETIRHVSEPSSTRGTKVTFTPDVERFSLSTVTSDHVELIRDRITNLAILFPKITFKVDGETIKFKSIKEVGKKFHPDAVTLETDNVSLVFAPSGAEEEYRFISYVNGIYVKNGGSHIDFIMNKLIESLRAFIKKKHKIEVKPDQIRQHILFGSWITQFPALKFDSQSKERITNTVSEVSAFLSSVDTDKLAKQITSTPAIIDPMIEAILYRKEMAEAKELAKKQKNTRKVNVLNHIVATDVNPENRTIFLTEGLCIEENTKVFTLNRGDVKIKNVEIGDIVLTNKHNFKPIISKSFALKKGIKINGTIYSENHRLFVYDLELDVFKFLECKNLKPKIHKLVSHRLISNGFRNAIHFVISVINDVVFTDRTEIQFSQTHEILCIDDSGITTKILSEIKVGDCILI